MSKTRRLVDVEQCVVRMIRDKAIAVSTGTMAEHEGRMREKWHWLPLSQIEVEPEDYDVGDEVVITLPEWLATDKDMI